MMTEAANATKLPWGDLATWAGAVAAFIASLVAYRAYRRPKTPPNWTVDEIIGAGPDCIAAFELLKERIPANERPDSDDIVKFMIDDRRWRWVPLRSRYRWYVVKHEQIVVGLLNVFYSPIYGLAFVSFLVTKKKRENDTSINPRAVTHHAAISLLDHILFQLQLQLPSIKAVLCEVDDPQTAKNEGERRKRESRIQRFTSLAGMHNLALRRIGVGYRQPALQGRPQSAAIPMALLYIPLYRQASPNLLSYRQTTHILSFVYNKLYGESYVGTDYDRQYRAEMRLLYESVSRSVGPTTSCDEVAKKNRAHTVVAYSSASTVTAPR